MVMRRVAFWTTLRVAGLTYVRNRTIGFIPCGGVTRVTCRSQKQNLRNCVGFIVFNAVLCKSISRVGVTPRVRRSWAKRPCRNTFDFRHLPAATRAISSSAGLAYPRTHKGNQNAEKRSAPRFSIVASAVTDPHQWWFRPAE